MVRPSLDTVTSVVERPKLRVVQSVVPADGAAPAAVRLVPHTACGLLGSGVAAAASDHAHVGQLLSKLLRLAVKIHRLPVIVLGGVAGVRLTAMTCGNCPRVELTAL